MSKVIVVLVGLPGAGKSTFRNKLVRHGYSVVSSDDHIEKKANWAGVTYNEAFSDNASIANKMMRGDFKLFLDQGADIIWDQTNLSVKKRKSILSQVPKAYKKVVVYFEIDEELRQQRLRLRPGKTIPAHVDNSMLNSYVRPTVEEGFDLVTCHTEWAGLTAE